MEGEEILVPISVVEDTIEAVHEQQAEALETAEHIAEAALEGERGRRIETLERELGECRSILEFLPTKLAEQTSQSMELLRAAILEEMSNRLNALAVAPLVVENPSPPLIPLSPEVLEEIIPAIQEPTPEPKESEVAPERKKKHRFL